MSPSIVPTSKRPASPSRQSLTDDANALLKHLLASPSTIHGIGHMTPSVYDTAWISRVKKDGKWLFPSALEYILRTQCPSGGWELPSAFDSILNTLSALLALQIHSVDGSFSDRISKAKHYLDSQLNAWDVASTERVGFEIIVPSLLSALSKEGIEFSFPQHKILMDIHDAKLSRIKPQLIYRQHSTLLHSLEGLIGFIDFDKVSHHKLNGSFAGSPSSTAAYLMHASEWDDDCETYLREAMRQCAVYGEGSIACTWPTTFFELSWVVCTLYDGGFDLETLDRKCMAQISKILHEGIQAENGIVGFAAEVGADADDTAKVILTLQHLGISVSLEPLCRTFETDNYFRCFTLERNPSMSTQCHVLSALLAAADAKKSNEYNASILKEVTFIAETWWTTNGDIIDKWHDSVYYPLLLTAQSLTKFMLMFDKGYFTDFPLLLLQTKVPIALFNILIRILQAQKPDGSWGSCEETAYALLGLYALSTIPFVSIMIPTIQNAFDAGHHFLTTHTDEVWHWIGKITYRIPTVTQGYVIAALHATSIPVKEFSSPEGHISRIVSIPIERIKEFFAFYRKMPYFRACQDWQLLAYLAEGYLYVPILQDVRTTIFGKEGTDKPYIEYIPFTWTSVNAMYKKYSCPQNCAVMMSIAVLNFQVDEFFDIMVNKAGMAAHPTLKQALDDIFGALEQGKDIRHMSFGDGPYAHLASYIHKYICFVVYYPTTQNASSYEKAHLRRELRAYMLSMLQQAEDNQVYAAQSSWDIFLSPKLSYPKWVRNNGSDTVSAPSAAAFFICHLSSSTNSNTEAEIFPTLQLKFISQDCITHLGTLSRIWNDWGSKKRDIAERNVNGMNFPECAGMSSEVEAKAEMRKVSDYERRCLYTGLKELREKMKATMGYAKGEALMDSFEFFFRGSEVYDAIYEFKDISTRRE